MRALLDTNAISETFKPVPDPGLLGELGRIGTDNLYLSVVTWGELHRGVLRMPTGRRRDAVDTWLRLIGESFADRMLPVDAETARLWSEVEQRRTRVGRPVAVPDALIAATALRHGLTLVTRNTPDFEHTGVTLLNPWT